MILFGEPATLLSRTVTGEDSDGNDVFTEVEDVVPGCVFDPGTDIELIQGQDLLTTKPTLYLPTGTVVAATGRLRVRGITYDVDGDPNDYQSPFTGWAPGVVANLKLVTG